MYDKIIRKTEDFIRQHHMIGSGDHIIAGVSGGADSMCLLLVLLELRKVFGHGLSVVHVEHGIRGDASLRDAAFVRHFCAECGIECHICHYCVPEYAREHGMSEEEAGRYLRYASFRKEKEKYPERNVKIAVAHHLGDNAETMLFHLARGTGIRGLAAIAPVRGDIIRPLLCVGRDEIEEYLARAGQDFCEDATNEMDLYSRNQIRHQVLPVLSRVNGRAAEHMYQTAKQLREIHDYLGKQAAMARADCCIPLADGVKVEKEPFLRLEPVIQKELLHQLLGMTAGSSRNITREHISQVTALFGKQNGRQVQLPYGMTAVRVYGGVEICTPQYAEDAGTAENAGTAEDAGNKAEKKKEAVKDQFSFHVIENISGHMTKICKKKYTKCFDYDKIKNRVCVRNRQPGDYLVIDASGSRQKLKKYLVNEKIPVREREQLLLLADGAHIMWVVGYRISSYYKVGEHTRRILEVTFCGGREDEGTDSGNDSRGRGKCTD